MHVLPTLVCKNKKHPLKHIFLLHQTWKHWNSRQLWNSCVVHMHKQPSELVPHPREELSDTECDLKMKDGTSAAFYGEPRCGRSHPPSYPPNILPARPGEVRRPLKKEEYYEKPSQTMSARQDHCDIFKNDLWAQLLAETPAVVTALCSSSMSLRLSSVKWAQQWIRWPVMMPEVRCAEIFVKHPQIVIFKLL